MRLRAIYCETPDPFLFFLVPRVRILLLLVISPIITCYNFHEICGESFAMLLPSKVIASAAKLIQIQQNRSRVQIEKRDSPAVEHDLASRPSYENLSQ